MITGDALAAIWQRIESYVAVRWTPREVIWIIEGPGEWCPPLSLATISTVEVWNSAGEWESATQLDSLLGGYWLSATGPFKFVGTVGAGAVPTATIAEAFRRLRAYVAADRGLAGASSESVSIGEAIRTEYRRDPAWLAMALQNSGAAA